MEDEQTIQRRRVLAAIRRSARVARNRGVLVVPLRESREHLTILMEDAREREQCIAGYDHIEDAIAFNADHPSWSDMRGFMKQ